MAYVHKASSIYLDNMQKKSSPVSLGRTEVIPDWFEKRNETNQELEAVDFELEIQKVLNKLGYTDIS